VGRPGRQRGAPPCPVAAPATWACPCLQGGRAGAGGRCAEALPCPRAQGTGSRCRRRSGGGGGGSGPHSDPRLTRRRGGTAMYSITTAQAMVAYMHEGEMVHAPWQGEGSLWWLTTLGYPFIRGCAVYSLQYESRQQLPGPQDHTRSGSNQGCVHLLSVSPVPRSPLTGSGLRIGARSVARGGRPRKERRVGLACRHPGHSKDRRQEARDAAMATAQVQPASWDRNLHAQRPPP
jgi:hypothetical protein